MRCVAGLQRRGLHVPLRWRAAHGLRFSKKAVRKRLRAKLSKRRSKQEAQYAWGLALQRFGYVLSIRRAQERLLAKAVSVVPRSQSFAKPRSSRRKHRLCAGAQSQIQEAVQAPAASQHVPVARVCLQAASPNAQCWPAVRCFVRCLTLQSRGRRPASRVKPLMSNVRPRWRALHVNRRR